jgi:hypothetical protein
MSEENSSLKLDDIKSNLPSLKETLDHIRRSL